MAGKTDPKVAGKLIGRGFEQSTSPSSTLLSEKSVALHACRSPFVSDDIFDASLLHGGTGKAIRVFSRRGEAGMEGGLIGYWNLRAGDGVVSNLLDP